MRIGCKTCIRFRGNTEGVRLLQPSLAHNHRMTVAMSNSYLRNRRMNPSVLEIVQELLPIRPNSTRLAEYLQSNKIFMKIYSPFSAGQLGIDARSSNIQRRRKQTQRIKEPSNWDEQMLDTGLAVSRRQANGRGYELVACPLRL